MPSEGRLTSAFSGRNRSAPDRAPVLLYPVVGSSGTAGSARGRSGNPSLTAPERDLSDRIRALQRALRGRIERREALLDMVRAVNATLEPERVAELIVERVATWVPAPCWAVVSSDLSGKLSVLADRGLLADLVPAVNGVARWVMEHGEEFLSADLARDVRNDARNVDGFTASVVAFPLTCRSRQVGAVIGLDRLPSAREPHLTPAVLGSLRVLLEPASIALDNALLLKRAEALSVTDDLTHLYNSRYLNQLLRRETKRAFRSNRPLSLLFLDLDGFKAINDTHGHLFGSRALVEAAAVIRASARETDVAARFGGDEFALVLPETGCRGALAVGERVRERIAAHRFLTGDGLDIRLTVSVGVATLPDVAKSPEELVQAADAAMYRVKGRGKNGIETAAPSADKQ